MLVLISDLHLTDKSSETVRPGAFRLFCERMHDLAYDASWRAPAKPGGKRVYRPIEEMDLVLLGDILDVIRSDRWHVGAARPWSRTNSKPFRDKVRSITKGILANNASGLALLKDLMDPESKLMTVPRAGPNGKPVTGAWDLTSQKRVRVTVRIHYMVGNHDWFYHLDDRAFDAIRKLVVDAFGLANDPAQPFPHDPAESTTVKRVLDAHEVFARHGDIYDPFNFEGNRDTSSLGDAIVVELLSRFPKKVGRALGSTAAVRPLLDGLNEIDNVRPLVMVPAWVDGLIRRTVKDRRQAAKVRAVWDRLANRFLQLQYVLDRDTYSPVDRVDLLQVILRLSGVVSKMRTARVMDWIGRYVGGRGVADYKDALSEPSYRYRSARFIVYGHTHEHVVVPLDTSGAPPNEYRRVHLNTGTWRRVHELARAYPDDEAFIDRYVMTYLAFFKDDERGGHHFESWSGSLDPAR